MERLLRIGFDLFITSFTSIISWLFIGIVIDKNLSNVFTLTYPLQCLMGIIISVFGVGANICVYKDKNKFAADNGIFYGIILACIIYIFFSINSDNYISFMNFDKNIYSIFCKYSILQILAQTILQLIVTKLYYLEKNKKANLIVVLFNLTNFLMLIITSLIFQNQILITSITLISLFLFDIVLFFKIITKINFKLNLKNCVKYDCVSCSISIMFFIIYLIGLSNSFAYGKIYINAITFATLITDTQWDMSNAIKIAAKIDIVKKKFNYNYHLKNALTFTIILIISVMVMGVLLYPIYKPQISIVTIFILMHFCDFIMMPFKNIKICYLELEYSPCIITFNTLVAFGIRTAISMISTPFCTILGQVCSSIYEFIYSNIIYKNYLVKIKNEI